MLHGDVLGERARLSGERTALVEVATGRRLSYRELDHRACRCAVLWLRGLGLEPGDRIGALSGNRVEMLDAFFAAGKSGVVLVPLNTRLTAVELAQIVRDSGLGVLMYSGDYEAVVRELVGHVPSLRLVPFDEPAAGPGADPAPLSYGRLIEQMEPGPPPARVGDPEHPYCLLYTSGTTGKPKGVITPHRQVAWNGYNTVVCWQLGEQDVSPIFTPLYHAGGLGAFLVPIVVAGGTIVLHAGFDAAEIWRSIEAERCTVVLGVPTIWKMLAEAPEIDQVDLKHLRWLISGGAPLPQHLIDLYQQRGLVLRQGYGLTEVGVNCFAMSSEEAWSKPGSIGRPFMMTEAKLIDRSGSEVAIDEVGELCFRGPHVSSGYWRNQEATSQALDEQGWFHTGDMARKDADGFYYIAGRDKDMFISGGVNVYPVEVENVLLQHPDLKDAAVVGVPHETWGEVGIAFIVPASSRPVEIDRLTGLLEQRLARFKIPREFITVDELPRTAYGKVVKGELVSRYLDQQGESE